MTTNEGAYVLIDDLVSELQSDQSLFAKKANTVTAAIGAMATALAAGLTHLIQTGADLPSWLTSLVFVLGMFGTTGAVAKTKNGMTDSVSTKLHNELTNRIDLNHIHSLSEDDVKLSVDREVDAAGLRDAADALVDREINQL